MPALTREEFTRKLRTEKRNKVIREARAEERFLNQYTIESCIRSVEKRRKYMNGMRCI